MPRPKAKAPPKAKSKEKSAPKSRAKPKANGRPTKYRDELNDIAWDFVSNYEKYGHPIPSITGLADVLEITTVTLYDWAKEGKGDFSYTLERCRDKQHLALIIKGLTNEFNATITKLMLANHGYHEKIEQTVTTDVKYSELSIEQLDEMNERLDLEEQLSREG